MPFAIATVFFCERDLRISSASSGTPSTLPPGESTSKTMALMLESPSAWRNDARKFSTEVPPEIWLISPV